MAVDEKLPRDAGPREVNPLNRLRQHEIDQIVQWVSRNRGILTKIGADCKPPCTPQFVHQVLRKLRKSKDGKVERLLREAGAPI